ncbi:MAG: TonB protein, partial [Alphaproteobacteria bacterium]
AAPSRPMPRTAPQPTPRLDPHPARARVEAPTAPPRDKGGGMRGLAFLIFLAVIGGGGYYAYQQFRGPAPASIDTAEDWVPSSASTNPADDGVAGPASAGDANVLASGTPRSESQSQRPATRQTPPAARAPVEEEPVPEPVFRTIPAAVPAAPGFRPPTTVGDPEAESALLRDVAPPPVETPAVQPATVSAPPAMRAPSRPQWAQRASARDLTAAYPDAAARRQIEGRVVLDCLIGADLAIRCRATSETPSGYGFAAAALRVAQRYRSQPTMADGRPAAGERTIIAIVFKPS